MRKEKYSRVTTARINVNCFLEYIEILFKDCCGRPVAMISQFLLDVSICYVILATQIVQLYMNYPTGGSATAHSVYWNINQIF